MDNDLIDDEGFDCFFTEADTLKQQCHLLEAELSELHGELRESRAKIATLVLMWSGVSRELAKVETELCQTKEALEVAVHQGQERASTAPERTDDDQPAPSPVAFDLKC